MRRDTTDFNLPATLIGSTPYLLAARFLEPDIMRGARGRRRRSGRSRWRTARRALMLATGMGSRTTASRRGIDDDRFRQGRTGKPRARRRRRGVRLGADPNAANQAGDTALHVAAARGYDTVVQWLVEHGARVNVKNKRGITPLAAAMFGSTAGRREPAAPAGADSLGFEPPIDLAHPSAVALLKKLGAG